jgi:pyrroloquinoline quinone (PQQ) biosynthesis protein C
MSRDTTLKATDGTCYSLDNLVINQRLTGKIAGINEAAAWLHERAVDLFRNGKDADATALRDLAKDMAKELGPKLQREAVQHAAEYPSELPRPSRSKAAP